jgi:hypothetical protein
MGINYDQCAIIGIELSINDLKVVDKEAVYENQNRYDTRTGKVSKIEKVLVQKEEYHYEFNSKSYDDFYSIENDYEDLESFYDDDYIYLGLKIGDGKDFGRVDMLEGSLSLEEISEHFKEMKEMFPDMEIKLYFVSKAG